MILTFAIEIAAALWVLWRYRHTTASKLIVATLFLLATFQFAEYMICEGAYIFSGLEWARIGFATISFLPALGVHLAMHLAGRVSKIGVVSSYIVAIAFAGVYMTVGRGVTASVCGGNYVIMSFMEHMHYPYILYYYGWSIVAMVYSFYWARRIKDLKRANALRWLAIGYASFLLPTAAVNAVNPATLPAIPSIMCGFAVFLALILLFFVAPQACELEKSAKKRDVGSKPAP